MSKKLYALLVGINDYPNRDNDLKGCINDIEGMEKLLKSRYSHLSPDILTLKDKNATRSNVIRGFRKHLRKAGPNDVVLFHFSGHGAQVESAPEFEELFPCKMDEAIILFSDCQKKIEPLADKEFAILLSEVGVTNPHIVLIMDCCHSGSLTRGINDKTLDRSRLYRGEIIVRKKPEYLDGYYTNINIKKLGINAIPKSKHLLLAACDRYQTALERIDKQGVFTGTLLEILNKIEEPITYRELFFKYRWMMWRYASKQDPLCEPHEYFNIDSIFLDGKISGKPKFFPIYNADNKWKIDVGALHGIPSDRYRKTELEIYDDTVYRTPNMTPKKIGTAELTTINAQKSIVLPHFELDKNQTYKGLIHRLPIEPMKVYAENIPEFVSLPEWNQNFSFNIAFTRNRCETKYKLVFHEGNLLIKKSDSDTLIHGAEGSSEESIEYIMRKLEHIYRWERTIGLKNENTKSMDFKNVKFSITDISNGSEKKFYNNDEKNEIEFKLGIHERDKIRISFDILNDTNQEFHFLLLYLSPYFEIHTLRNDPLKGEKNFRRFFGGEGDEFLYLRDGVSEVTDIFKLIISTERVDEFIVEQDKLDVGDICSISGIRGSNKDFTTRDYARIKVTDDWFTKTAIIRTIR